MVLMGLMWMMNPNYFYAPSTNADNVFLMIPVVLLFPGLPVIKKGLRLSRTPRRGSQLSVRMADVAFVADNHGAWLKFAPSCMSDEQWEVAAKTPEAVLSHRSCPWGGHLIKLDSKTLGADFLLPDICHA